MKSGTVITLGVRRSQADVMLELLQDGDWHTIAELSDHGVGRPNSRAAELRAKRGLAIEHDHDRTVDQPSRAHRYRLVPAEPNGQLILAGAAT